MKKLGLLCLAIVLAMGSLGVGYAMWSDTVTVSGPVTTGVVDVCVTDISSNEEGTGPWQGSPDPQCDIGKNPEGKDIGWVSYRIIDCDEIEFTVHNAYPFYKATAHYSVCNVGNIPVRWQQPLVVSYDPTVMVVNAWDGAQIEPRECNDFTFDVCILQAAEQGATYTFTIQVKYVQWNEWTP